MNKADSRMKLCEIKVVEFDPKKELRIIKNKKEESLLQEIVAPVCIIILLSTEMP
jgi:hypothetical protein